jgi:hypothetical protein
VAPPPQVQVFGNIVPVGWSNYLGKNG